MYTLCSVEEQLQYLFGKCPPKVLDSFGQSMALWRGDEVNIKKRLAVRAVRHWHRLPGEAVGAPSLETPKVRLDGALSS